MAPEYLVVFIASIAGSSVVGLFAVRMWIRRQEILMEGMREQVRREALLDAKEESLRLTQEHERREFELARREEELEHAQQAANQLQESLQSSRAETLALRERAEAELAQIAQLDKDTAQNLYLSRLDDAFRTQGKRRALEIEADAMAEAESRARRVVLDSIQRNVLDFISEGSVTVITLATEDMKGRIIGREGRNIRAFEQITGVDLIIDETPESVTLSSFDPVRREIARRTLVSVMSDGRIHPVKIEEAHVKATEEVEREIREAGQLAAEAANVIGLSPRVLETLGRLRYRTSYAQNVLDHSVETARIAASLAHELGFDPVVTRRAALIHDIGKALGDEWEGPHALAGMAYLESQGEREPVLNAVGAHHYEIEPASPEALLVIVADTLSAARPGARREALDNYVKRLAALEQLALSLPGVERCYAVQAGREVRLMVRPEEIDDLGAVQLANDVAARIEQELVEPGQVEVTGIREVRASQVAK